MTLCLQSSFRVNDDVPVVNATPHPGYASTHHPPNGTPARPESVLMFITSTLTSPDQQTKNLTAKQTRKRILHTRQRCVPAMRARSWLIHACTGLVPNPTLINDSKFPLTLILSLRFHHATVSCLQLRILCVRTRPIRG